MLDDLENKKIEVPESEYSKKQKQEVNEMLGDSLNTLIDNKFYSENLNQFFELYRDFKRGCLWLAQRNEKGLDISEHWIELQESIVEVSWDIWIKLTKEERDEFLGEVKYVS